MNKKDIQLMEESYKDISVGVNSALQRLVDIIKKPIYNWEDMLKYLIANNDTKADIMKLLYKVATPKIVIQELINMRDYQKLERGHYEV